MECTGAQILLESMKREGVDVLFGYPGGAVIDIYDELPRHPELRHVLVRHEQGAVHAAMPVPRARPAYAWSPRGQELPIRSRA